MPISPLFAVLLAAGLPDSAAKPPAPPPKTIAAPAVKSIPAFDSTRAYGYLKAQCALGPRNPGSEGHARAIPWFAEHFRKLGLSAQLQPFVHKDIHTGAPVSLTNIVVTVKGSSPGRKPVIFCAHWDTRPRGEQDPDPRMRDRPILGANDGASGVAVLMELAHALSKRPPAQTVFLALFDGEDYGREGSLEEYFLGARHFAANPPAKEFAYALLLDMVGDADLRILPEANSVAQSPALVRGIWTRARDLGLSAFAEGIGPTVFDDHMPLQAKGIPAVDLIDFDYRPWHTQGDTPDKCSARSLGIVGRLVTSLAYRPLP